MKPVIKLRLKSLTPSGILSLANSVFVGLTAASGTYTTPFPALIALTNAINALDSAITIWGTPGNRGSHADHIILLAARADVETILTQLANYCMDTTPYDELSLSSTGFELKSARNPQGVLQVVQHLHNFISRQLKWKKPLNVAVNGNIKMYKVFRNTDSYFSTATLIATPTKSTYIDTPPSGTSFYWVVAVNTSGDGVVSDVCQVEVA